MPSRQELLLETNKTGRRSSDFLAAVSAFRDYLKLPEGEHRSGVLLRLNIKIVFSGIIFLCLMCPPPMREQQAVKKAIYSGLPLYAI